MSAWPAQSNTALPQQASREIVQFRQGTWSTVNDAIATEYALTIFVNDNELATIVCTPDHLEELVVGFLASEGIVKQSEDIDGLSISRFMGTARVRTKHLMTFNQEFYNKRYITSCCGKGRQSFYFHNDAVTAKHVDDAVKLKPAQIFGLLDAMDEEAVLFHQTGGVHMAALCRPDELMISRTDIGRHNALDKIYGHVLQTGVPLTGSVIAFSGRISSEVLLKVAKIGVGIVLARSAPTALSIDMADELGITAVGFVRGASFNVYTHSWRVAQGGG